MARPRRAGRATVSLHQAATSSYSVDGKVSVGRSMCCYITSTTFIFVIVDVVVVLVVISACVGRLS